MERVKTGVNILGKLVLGMRAPDEVVRSEAVVPVKRGRSRERYRRYQREYMRKYRLKKKAKLGA